MANRKVSEKLPPVTTPEARENQVIAMAYDLAEKQIREGTASAQVLTHFLKMGSVKERLERDKMNEETKLLAAKTESISDSKKFEALVKDALDAMKKYQGSEDDFDE